MYYTVLYYTIIAAPVHHERTPPLDVTTYQIHTRTKKKRDGYGIRPYPYQSCYGPASGASIEFSESGFSFQCAFGPGSEPELELES
jgi:hypothetical protein